KTFPPAVVAAALAAGLRDIGENYVQEARAKRARLDDGATWHLIGGLQRNKVRAAAATFECVHTVDSPGLAAAPGAVPSRRLAVLIQVDLSADGTRRGVRPEHVEAVARSVMAEPNLAFEGLMTLPPASARMEDNRRHFR